MILTQFLDAELKFSKKAAESPQHELKLFAKIFLPKMFGMPQLTQSV